MAISWRQRIADLRQKAAFANRRRRGLPRPLTSFLLNVIGFDVATWLFALAVMFHLR